MGPRHNIQRQIIEVTVDDQTTAQATMDQVRELYLGELIPLMTRIFDEYSAEGIVLELDELVLDLGAIDARNLEYSLRAALESALPKALTEVLVAPKPEKGQKVVSKPQSELAALRHFLRHGVVPWWGKAHKGRFAEMVAAYAEGDAAPLRQLLTELRTQPQVFRRFVLQFGLPNAEAILAQADPELARYSDVLLQIFAMLERLTSGLAFTAARLRQEVLAVLLAEAHDRRRPSLTTRIAVVLATGIQRLSTSSGLFQVEAALRIALRAAVDATGAAPMEDGLPQALKQAEARIGGKKSGVNLPELLRRLPDIQQLQASAPLSALKAQAQQSREAEAQPREPLRGQRFFTEPEEVYVDNAGLVLLHPFLPHFFATLGLTENDVFHDEAAAGFAALVLEYVATGQPAAEEADLALNKVLCGLDPATPIATDVALSPAQCAEADALLAAVIENWAELGAAQPDDLRSTFLQREARLIDKENHWELQVDRKTVDLLVDRLKWAIGAVKLPWMENFLHVVW